MQNTDILKQKIQGCLASEDLIQAKKHLKKLCKFEPDNFHAWYSLGSINGQLGKFNDAIKSLHKALSIEPSSIEALSILGLAFFSANRHEEAITIYNKLITLDPNNIDALINIGAAYIVLEKYKKAIPYLQRSLKIEKNSVAFANLGKAYHHINENINAQKQLKIALEIDPTSLDALMIMGDIHHKRHNHEKSLEYYKRVIQYHPDAVEGWNNVGLVLYDIKLFEDAIFYLEEALKLSPQHLNTMLNLGLCLIATGQENEAEKIFLNCVHNNPLSAKAYLHLGTIQHELGKSKLALISQTTSLKLEPDNYQTHIAISEIYLSMSRHKESTEQLKKACEIVEKRSLPNYLAINNLLFGMNYDSNNTTSEIYKAHKYWGKIISDQFTPHNHKDKIKNKKIKIGYLSSDFIEHSVAYFLEPIIFQHNKNQFEIYCYSNSPKHDEITKRFQCHASHWRDVHRMADEVLHEKIINDDIDILVDLMGHTANNRLSILPQKPAPIQITYLGYPNTTGLTSIDYRIVDEITDPINNKQYNTESLARLPNCFLCYQPPVDAPPVTGIPVAGNNYITFGSFNNLSKITENVVRTYSEILTEVSNSKLVLKNRSFHDNDIRDHFFNLFSNNNIDASRLILLATTPTTTEHLKLYNTIDIALDTFPYNGTTTTCEALYMGTPIITFLGDRHSARVSASILTAIKHEELIAESEQDYVRIAVRLANDLSRLKKYNENLRANMLNSPLCDAPSFTNNLERLYKGIYADYYENSNL